MASNSTARGDHAHHHRGDGGGGGDDPSTFFTQDFFRSPCFIFSSATINYPEAKLGPCLGEKQRFGGNPESRGRLGEKCVGFAVIMLVWSFIYSLEDKHAFLTIKVFVFIFYFL